MQISIDKFVTSPKINNIFPGLAELYNKAYNLPENVFNNNYTEVETFSIYYLINNKVVMLCLIDLSPITIEAYCYNKNNIDGPSQYTALCHHASLGDFISSIMFNIKENEIKESYPLFIQVMYRVKESDFWLYQHSFIACLANLTSDIWAVKASGILTEQTKGSLFEIPAKHMESVFRRDLDDLVCLTDSLDADIQSGKAGMNGWIVEVKRSI